MGAIEKIPRPFWPACFSKPSAIRNAGAPMIVIVVPNEAAKDNGINNLEAGMSLSRESFSKGGSIRPVMVTFFFQAEDGIRDLYVTGVQTCALPILTKIVEQQVQPAMKRQRDCIAAIRSQATSDAGVWKLPKGEAYYKYALKYATTTSLDRKSVV